MAWERAETSQVPIKIHHVLFEDLDKRASRQFGLISTPQLHHIGLTSQQIEWQGSRGVLIRVRHLVYRLAGAPVVWEQAVMAAVLGARRSAVVSHQTAAAVWGLKHSDRESAGMHLSADRRVELRGVTSHVGRLTSHECTRLHGIPITTAERTIMDLAGALSLRQLGECVDDALRRRLIQLEELRRLVTLAAAARHGRRLLAPLHQVLADRIRGYRVDDSDFEKRMNAEWDRLKLPPCERQYRVRCGAKTYRLDVAIPDIQVGIEWESLAFHGTRSGMDSDSDRRADLTAEGWVILSFTWNTRPERIARAVHRLWRDRGGQPPAPP
jgi:predicted transcriptional regulator of viral defense system